MLFNNYGQRRVTLVKGKGSFVWDEDGKEYLDFTSGIAVCNLGHCYSPIVEAVEKQLHTLWHTSNLFGNPLQERVAQLLTEHSCGEYVFFCNSGAEANEAAIKLARKYTGKSTFITFQGSFHGRTFATMSATGQGKIKEGFGDMLPTFHHLPYNDVLALEERMDESIAGVIVEIIQGEGGVNIGQRAFLQRIQELCLQYNALFIIDEVQTGIGRTGKAFAYQHHDLEPDILTLAKGLGNGFPVGAVIGKGFLGETFSPGSHGSTFGGNYLAMAAAEQVLLKVFQDNFVQGITEKSNRFMEILRQMLKDSPMVVNIRGKGMMIGIECKEDVTKVIKTCENQGLLLLSAGPKTIRILPSLLLTEEEWVFGLKVLKKSMTEGAFVG